LLVFAVTLFSNLALSLLSKLTFIYFVIVLESSLTYLKSTNQTAFASLENED